jgi:hypothetical protein
MCQIGRLRAISVMQGEHSCNKRQTFAKTYNEECRLLIALPSDTFTRGSSTQGWRVQLCINTNEAGERLSPFSRNLPH